MAALFLVLLSGFSSPLISAERAEAEKTLGVVYADGRQTEDIPLLGLEEDSAD